MLPSLSESLKKKNLEDPSGFDGSEAQDAERESQKQEKFRVYRIINSVNSNAQRWNQQEVETLRLNWII